ncbi:MAG TPA: hypothetical protein VHO06_26155 [Polyangia bacterium]|nr:hypothetical protein [Polyangia bacterium]
MSDHLFDSYHWAAEAMQAARRRWIALAVELLDRQRESTEALYQSVIHLVEQSSRISEAKSTEELRHAGEDFWNTWMEGLRNQSEARLREAQRFTEKSLEIAHGAQA